MRPRSRCPACPRKTGTTAETISERNTSSSQKYTFSRSGAREISFRTVVIDGILHHESELDIQRHYTDTAGYTDQIFGLTHLLGFMFAPRIRDSYLDQSCHQQADNQTPADILDHLEVGVFEHAPNLVSSLYFAGRTLRYRLIIFRNKTAYQQSSAYAGNKGGNRYGAISQTTFNKDNR